MPPVLQLTLFNGVMACDVDCVSVTEPHGVPRPPKLIGLVAGPATPARGLSVAAGALALRNTARPSNAPGRCLLIIGFIAGPLRKTTDILKMSWWRAVPTTSQNN